MLRPQVFAVSLDRSSPDSRAVGIGLIASEKQAIDRVLAALAERGLPYSSPADRYWNARGGSYSDGGAFHFTLGETGPLRVADKFGRPLVMAGTDPTLELARRESRKELEAALARAERIARAADAALPEPKEGPESLLGVEASGFAVQGAGSVSSLLVEAYAKGWRRFSVFGLMGHRFLGCGLGPGSRARIDCHGPAGDYLGSGLDGGSIRVFDNAQDQVGQILKSGRLVIYGDVGQTFLYGAKGGECFVLGNAAGRPLINAVGRPRVVINGTCLDYLAESFMAGDPLRGGGFAIVNGVRYAGEGRLEELETPYPGGNLFSLASGGAIYFRDPARRIGEDQLNGGRLAGLEPADWDLIRPYLEENERLFGVALASLLSFNGRPLPPAAAYIKIVPTKLKALTVAHD
ncbi:MAG: hypothetical protein HY554_11695 [Elusimicrobia bacterium]|nr:hypothetical protein [Elusimicrobiota bacterium]